MIFPGGETRCLKSYSTPYAFQVHKGARNKLLFYFQVCLLIVLLIIVNINIDMYVDF